MTPRPVSPLVHYQDQVSRILESHTWGTIGPVEDETAAAACRYFGYSHCLLVHSEQAAVETLLRAMHRWPLDDWSDLPAALLDLDAVLARFGHSVPEYTEETKPRFLIVDFRSLAAILTDEEDVYGDLFAYHHCGHRPGTGATVDGTKDSILGGDMRVTEFQALAALLMIRH